MLATRTFLFSDLREYTAFVERHGDAAAATLITEYRRIVRAEIAKHEGAEVKTEGDSFYVVFTTTGSAVSCAAAILREADRYSRERPDRPMRIGAGIHAGEPVPHEGQFVGTAVIVAARLAQSATAGELLVTEVVRALLPRSLTLPMTERTGLILKGIEQPPRIYAVDWHAAPPTRADRVSAPNDTAIAAASPTTNQVLSPIVVGRDREAATLDEQLLEAIAGRGRAILVSGEAGLGKSALLRRFLDRARTHEVRVLKGECTEIEARRPFGPFIDAFTGGDLALPPELSQGGPGALPVAEVERYRVHATFAERLAEAARERPIVVVIEDLHWADEATNELIPYLARKLRDARVLLLITYRSDELHRLHPLNHVLAELSRGRLAEDIRLKRLTLEEVGDVIRAALQLSRAPTPEFRQALFDRTEGNPFFVEEILRALVEKGELEYRDGSWHRTKSVAELAIPASVRDAVQQRLLGLEPRARKAMQVAAVIGQRFDFEILGTVSGLDEAALLDAIKTAIEAQLVREETDSDGNETYAFRHALSREAVLTELLQRERRMLHKAVGEAIEKSAARPEERAEELAYHFDEARDAVRAYRYHAVAAERSVRMASPAGAIRHLERAIELAPDEDEAELGTLLLRLSDIALSVADTPRALRAVEQARSMADERGDRLAAGEAIYRIAVCRWYLGETSLAMETAREGVMLLEPFGSSAPLAACYGELARLAMIDHRYEEAIDLGERAAAMAREVGARETEIKAMNTVGTAIGTFGDRGAEGLVILQRGFDLAEEQNFTVEAERALNNMLAVLAQRDARFSEMQEVHGRSIAYAKKHGHRSDAQISREVLYPFLAGEWDMALATAEEFSSDGIWGASREQLAATILVAREGPLPAHLARADAAHRRLLAAGDKQWLAVATASAGTYFVAERWAEAIARADPGYGLLTSGDDFGPTREAAVIAARAAKLLGDEATERRWLDVLVTLSGSLSRDAVALCARTLAAQGEAGPDDAVESLRRGLGQLKDRIWPFVNVVYEQELIELLVASGRHAEAADVLRELVGYWQRAKATWYLGRLESWARGLGVETAGR